MDQKVKLVRQVTFLVGMQIVDPFANYVVQFVLELRDPGVNHAIG